MALDANVKAIRQLMFTPCQTKQHLVAWIKFFLKADLPTNIVLEESNSSPVDIIWEIYDRLRRNDTEGFERYMCYASRFGGKTLSASILETLVLVHLARDVGHLAALKIQSQKAQEYVKGFFRNNHLRDFVVGDNSTEVKISAYHNVKTGEYLTVKEFNDLAAQDQGGFSYRENYIRIVVLTYESTNGQHFDGLMVLDEVDVITGDRVRAYDQAKSIPSTKKGLQPITLLTSTRKSRVGLVQKELDKAEESGLQVRHWNLIDVTEPCPTTRHKPELPKQTYYVNDDDVLHWTEDEFKTKSEIEKRKCYPVEGYAGCGKCRLFAACKGNLATKQAGSAKTTWAMSTIQDVANKFKGAPSPEYITTEYLCRKPDTSGMVFPRFDKNTHLKTAKEIAEMITGEPQPLIQSKLDLLNLMKGLGIQFYSGMDFGYTHDFSIVTVAVWGHTGIVMDCFSEPGLELEDQIDAASHLKVLYDNPAFYPDLAEPGIIASFRKRGFKMKDWDKKGGTVRAGIEIVRTLIWSNKGDIRFYLLKDDPGCEYLARQIAGYRLKIDSIGNYTEEPEDEDDDALDAMRYVIMNVFGKKGGVRTYDHKRIVVSENDDKSVDLLQKEMQDVVNEHLNQAEEKREIPNTSIKKGGFRWDI